MLADTIKNVVAAFPPEVGQADEDSSAKVARLTKITQDLQCQVEYLQHLTDTKHTPKGAGRKKNNNV